MNGIELDIQVNERAGADWVLGPGLTTPLVTDATAAWGLPTVAPEVLLFYSAPGCGKRSAARTRGRST